MAIYHSRARIWNVVLLSATLMGLFFTAVLNNALIAFINPLHLSSISEKYRDLFQISESCTATPDSYVSP